MVWQTILSSGLALTVAGATVVGGTAGPGATVVAGSAHAALQAQHNRTPAKPARTVWVTPHTPGLPSRTLALTDRNFNGD
jgi:hypothetical protein